jgi:hypothetical protein
VGKTWPHSDPTVCHVTESAGVARAATAAFLNELLCDNSRFGSGSFFKQKSTVCGLAQTFSTKRANTSWSGSSLPLRIRKSPGIISESRLHLPWTVSPSLDFPSSHYDAVRLNSRRLMAAISGQIDPSGWSESASAKENLRQPEIAIGT